ncbi:MAG: hypothetical protein LBK82_14580 [Planctomycetaceae bacterium]|jgi:hypothetical protein|nr:hypothetical protein [Planctomycetaceae bacterium]
MKKTVIITGLFLFVLLTVFPLQAGKNLFDRKKEQGSGDSEMPPGSKTKVSPEQSGKIENIKQSVQQGNSRTIFSYYYLLFISVLILTIALFYLLYKYYWERHTFSLDDPWNLFRELCTAHELTRLERQLLRHIAEERHWSNPLQIFIEPLHLKSALDLKRFEKSQSLIESLLEKLFNVEIKNELLTETQTVDPYSPLTTTILYQNKETAKNELSGVKTAK